MRISDWSSDVCSSDLGHVAGAPLDYSGLPGATNRAWDVTLLGELGVPDREALRPRNLTLEAWLKPDEGGGTYQGALFKASSSAWTDGYGLVRVGDSIRFFIDNWTETYVEAPLAIGSWQDRKSTRLNSSH